MRTLLACPALVSLRSFGRAACLQFAASPACITSLGASALCLDRPRTHSHPLLASLSFPPPRPRMIQPYSKHKSTHHFSPSRLLAALPPSLLACPALPLSPSLPLCWASAVCFLLARQRPPTARPCQPQGSIANRPQPWYQAFTYVVHVFVLFPYSVFVAEAKRIVLFLAFVSTGRRIPPAVPRRTQRSADPATPPTRAADGQCEPAATRERRAAAAALGAHHPPPPSGRLFFLEFSSRAQAAAVAAAAPKAHPTRCYCCLCHPPAPRSPPVPADQ